MQNNDLISRTALLTAYDSAHKGPPGRARKLIEEAPTVDAAPVVHGRWMDRKYGDQKECSECGEICCCQGDYCMKCGARMDGGENGAGQ